MGNFCNQAKVKLVDLKESKGRILFNVFRMRSIIKTIGIYLAVASLVIWLIGGATGGGLAGRVQWEAEEHDAAYTGQGLLRGCG